MKQQEELNNTETDEGTVALQKKRSRRVSFAEITSVHVFDRDEDVETPPEPKPSSVVNNDNRKADDEVLGFFRELADTEDSIDLPNGGDGDDGDDDEEVMDGRKSFFRSIDSPSPGSTFGSATSNDDEENFFGPVSASFIRPGRYSDSAASEDDNHDVTMDSTAFSMHFRSLVRSESGGDLKTPTGSNLAVEQKTPTPNTTGSLMVLTGDKKPILHSPISVEKVSHSEDSNDMSLVGENPHRYDYAKLSPRLDALLAEGSKDLPSDAVLVPASESPSYPNKGVYRVGMNGNGPLDPKDSADTEQVNHGFHGSAEAAPVAHTEVSNTNNYSTIIPMDEGPVLDASFVNQAQSPKHLDRSIPLDQSVDSIEDAFESSRLKAKFCDIISENLSVSSLSAKQQVSLDSDKSFGHTRFFTPEKWPRSFSSQESTRHSKSMSSIQKSVSKLNILRNSPYMTTLQDGKHNSRRLSNFPSIPSFDMNGKDPQSKHVDVPIARLEDQFLRMDRKKGEYESLTNMDSNDTETPKNIKNFIQTEETTDKFNKSEATMMTSSPFTLSGMKGPQFLLESENFTEGVPVTSGTDFSLVETALQHIKDKKAIDSPEYFVSSPVKGFNKLAVSSEYKGNLNMELKLQNESDNLVSFVPEEDRDCLETVTSGSQFSAKDQKKDLLSVERMAHSHTPLNEINNSKDSAKVDRINFRWTNQDLLKHAEAFTNLQSPLRKIETLNFQLGTPNENRQTGTDPARFRNLTGEEIISSSHGSASPHVSRKSTNEPSLKEIQSLSRKHSRNVSHDGDNVHPSVDNSSRRKRQREELVLNDRDQMDEIANTQKSPKVQKSGSNNTMILLEHLNETNDERIKIGGDLSLKHSSDIFSKFLAELESLHSPLVDKLNLRGISVLEDIVVHLQKVKTFEMLCSDVQSQKIYDLSSDIRHKRASETRSLQCRMIYERAKMKLLQMRRERLQKKVDVLRYRTQEAQTLKMKISQVLFAPRTRDAQVDDSHHYGAKHVVANDKVTTMKQEAEALERQIKHLTKSFHTRLKVKGELSSADTLVLVNDHLKRRSCCKFIRQDLQSWEIDDLESRSGHRDVVINYHGFIFQRFTLATPVSSVIVSNKLNDANIVKKFPNMDACTAFAFMLKADNNGKYVGGRSLAQETQMTSSLLGNLLDVIEEICLARLELSNLTDTRFHSPSVEQLDLLLDFTDLRSGEKMILTLDMTCLDCGVYPSEILPSQFQAPAAGRQTSPPQTLLAETRAALEGLRVGFSRIIRLCRCVSQVIEASSR